jgi:hypothetical protein
VGDWDLASVKGFVGDLGLFGLSEDGPWPSYFVRTTARFLLWDRDSVSAHTGNLKKQILAYQWYSVSL